MTERDFVEKIQTAIKAEPALRGAVTFKLAETLTSGIPDLSITVLGRTIWLEVKYLRRGKKLKDIVNQLQLVTCHQLTVAGASCWVVVYEAAPKRLVIWQPRALYAHLWPRPDMTNGNPIRTPGVTQWGDPMLYNGDKPPCKMREAIGYYGSLYANDHPHELVARLVREATI